MNRILLASYPRSGNTFLRTLLWNNFGFKSGSVYKNDLGGNKNLENFVGHIEHENGHIYFPSDQPIFLKTHALDIYPGEKTIYVVRNGLDALRSLLKFYSDEIIESPEYSKKISKGELFFKDWASHLQSWVPWRRQHTLFLRYEEMASDPLDTILKLSEFLNVKPINTVIPERDTISNVDGKWVRKATENQDKVPEHLKENFMKQNSDMMKFLGY